LKEEKNVKKYLKAIPAMLAALMLIFAAACSSVNEKEAPSTAKTVTGVELVDSEALEENEAVSDGVTAVAATSSKTITATLLPEGAMGGVDWTFAWQNAESTWASGKTVTDYVSVTPTADGALTATVKALKAFGEKVVVTVTSRSNPEAQAQCVCDYAKRRNIILNPIEQGEFPVMRYRFFRNSLSEGTVNTTISYSLEAEVVLDYEFFGRLIELMNAEGYPYGVWRFVSDERVNVSVDPGNMTITFPADNFADNFCELLDEEELQHNGLTQAELKSSLNAAFRVISEELFNGGQPCAVFRGTYTIKFGNTVIENNSYFTEIFFAY